MPVRSAISPQSPRGAQMATAMATSPRMMKYQVPSWDSVCCRMKKTIVPRIGPSIVPMPPMIVTKIISADHCTLNAAVGSTNGWLMMSSAPAAPHPAAATMNTSRCARATLAPTLRAPVSSSRSAVRTSPRGLRSRR